MWGNQKLLPIEERGAFKSIVLGFVLMLTGTAALYYGNIFIENYSEHLESNSFPPMLVVTTFSVLIHGLQMLLLFLAWISISRGISRYFGRAEIAVRLLVSSAGIWATWVVFPLLSKPLVYSFPLNLYMTLLLVVLFEILTQHVDNWLDRSAAMMLWVYSFQCLEMLPTFMEDGRATSALFKGMFRTNEEIAIASMAGSSLFLSFMAGAVISTWVLASYSTKLSQVRRSWSEELGDTKGDEDEGLRKVSMVDMRNLVHDLKNPLAAVKGMAFLLRDSKNSCDAASEKVDIMLNATNYMERMIGEILHEEQLHEVQVEPFFDRLRSRIRPFPWGYDVTVSIDPNARQESVALNEIRFTRALLNVLDNAWRANRTAGTRGIELHVRRNDAFLEIEILDNGPGIGQSSAAPRSVHHKSGWGSTGLGLAFSRKVVAAHGGNLLLSQRRDAPNGASVMISLPLCNML